LGNEKPAEQIFANTKEKYPTKLWSVIANNVVCPYQLFGASSWWDLGDA
jgi:hypothetical protein